VILCHLSNPKSTLGLLFRSKKWLVSKSHSDRWVRRVSYHLRGLSVEAIFSSDHFAVYASWPKLVLPLRVTTPLTDVQFRAAPKARSFSTFVIRFVSLNGSILTRPRPLGFLPLSWSLDKGSNRPPWEVVGGCGGRRSTVEYIRPNLLASYIPTS